MPGKLTHDELDILKETREQPDRETQEHYGYSMMRQKEVLEWKAVTPYPEVK